jgi:hypothetical protein
MSWAQNGRVSEVLASRIGFDQAHEPCKLHFPKTLTHTLSHTPHVQESHSLIGLNPLHPG